MKIDWDKFQVGIEHAGSAFISIVKAATVIAQAVAPVVETVAKSEGNTDLAKSAELAGTVARESAKVLRPANDEPLGGSQ